MGKQKNEKPRYSVIIALAPWREPEVLDSINTQDFEKEEYEVIIEKGTNVPINRNNGFKKSKGEIIIFLDDDAMIGKDYLKNIDLFFQKHPEMDILGGPQLTPKTDGLFARSNGHVLGSFFCSTSARNRYRAAKLNLKANSDYLTGANLIAKRRVLDKIKFKENVYPSDDVNFVETAKREGFKVGYDPKVRIYHRRRGDLSNLIEQIFDYARSRPKFSIKENILKRPLFVVPSLFLLYLFVIPFIAPISWVFLIPLLIYLSLNLVFSIETSLSNRDPLSLIFTPSLFLIIHITYGLGLIVGLLERFYR